MSVMAYQFTGNSAVSTAFSGDHQRNTKTPHYSSQRARDAESVSLSRRHHMSGNNASQSVSNAENLSISWRHHVPLRHDLSLSYQQGIVLAGFIYQCELFPLTDRTVAVLLGIMCWPIGMFILDLFAYFIRNWRHLMIATSVPVVLIIPLFWYVI